ncbi:MAG: DUF4153 domain-containing protein, partial [Bacteroidia bacterium]|nr:DUF4153 domain-containing protein [Bacteroidia bacterium]
MKEKIKEHINDPEKLEQLFHDDKAAFEAGFKEVFSEIEKSELAKYWKIRLDFKKQPETAGKINYLDVAVLLTSCLIAGFLIKIPYIFNGLQQEIFYTRNAGIIVFLGLTLNMVWTNRIF